MFRKHNKAQSTAEFAIVVSMVIGAIVVMQVYVKKSLQGRIKTETDTALGAAQFNPNYTNTQDTTGMGSNETVDQAGTKGDSSEHLRSDRTTTY
jgi:hypothetical protein